MFVEPILKRRWSIFGDKMVKYSSNWNFHKFFDVIWNIVHFYAVKRYSVFISEKWLQNIEKKSDLIRKAYHIIINKLYFFLWCISQNLHQNPNLLHNPAINSNIFIKVTIPIFSATNLLLNHENITRGTCATFLTWAIIKSSLWSHYSKYMDNGV